MEQTRKLRDGSIGVASTIYLKKVHDDKAAKISKERTRREKRVVSKSAVLVETIERHL